MSKLHNENGQFTGDYTQVAIHAKQLETENTRLRAELEKRTYNDDRDSIIAELEAELEALKPKPVVTKKFFTLTSTSIVGWGNELRNPSNLVCTFADGVLVDATVIKQGESK